MPNYLTLAYEGSYIGRKRSIGGFVELWRLGQKFYICLSWRYEIVGVADIELPYWARM